MGEVERWEEKGCWRLKAVSERVWMSWKDQSVTLEGVDGHGACFWHARLLDLDRDGKGDEEKRRA